MHSFNRSAASDAGLLRDALLHARHERTCTAVLLADLAEIDARRLHVPAGYPSITEYHRGALKLSDDAAGRRIHAARAARRFPAIFVMCADGRLTLTAINQLAPVLTEENANGLLAAAAGKSRTEVEVLIRERWPVTESIGWVETLASSPGSSPPSPAPARVDAEHTRASVATGRAAARPSAASPAPARVHPIARGRFAVQGTLDRRAADALQFARATTGKDVSAVLEAALVRYAAHLRRRACGATARPRRAVRATSTPRHVPAHVKRAVWQRDGGRCTFTSDDGHRCGSAWRLEYDHILPVARGGRSTVDNIRLRCRAHNQYEAERAFGAAFMAAGAGAQSGHRPGRRRRRMRAPRARPPHRPAGGPSTNLRPLLASTHVHPAPPDGPRCLVAAPSHHDAAPA